MEERWGGQGGEAERREGKTREVERRENVGIAGKGYEGRKAMMRRARRGGNEKRDGKGEGKGSRRFEHGKMREE